MASRNWYCLGVVRLWEHFIAEPVDDKVWHYIGGKSLPASRCDRYRTGREHGDPADLCRPWGLLQGILK